MSMKKCAFALLIAFTLILSGLPSAFAAEVAPAFDLTYDEASDSFVVTGEAKPGSRVLLMAYSPLYEDSLLQDLYYVEAKNQVDGPYEFRVKMHDGCTLGTYTFRVSVNGVDAGSASKEYVWPDFGYDNIRRFVFDQKMAPGGSISAVAVIGDSEEPLPTVMIALYEGSKLKEVQIGSTVSSENGETEIRATIDELPQTVAGCSVKAFLLKDLSSLQPMTRCLYEAGN